MGMFSFLTGKKEEKPAGVMTSVTSDPPAAAPATAPRASDWDFGADTPFHPPEAWNIDSLTAPKPEQPGEVSQAGPLDPAQTAEFQQKIIDVIKTVYDPEIPVDIYELGLIYDILVDAERRVLVKMTLTSPACPSAQQIPSEARYKVKAIPGVKNAWVEVVWEPPWGKERMSEAAKLQLGFF